MCEGVAGLFCTRGAGAQSGSNGGAMAYSNFRFGLFAVNRALEYLAQTEAPAAIDWTPVEEEVARLEALRTRTPENGLRLRFIAPCGAADQFHERNTLFRRAEIDFVARRRDLLPRQAARTAMRHIERTYTGNYDGTVIQQLTGNDLIYLCDHGVLCFGEKAISAQVSFYGRAKRASPRRQGATTPARSYKFRKG